MTANNSEDNYNKFCGIDITSLKEIGHGLQGRVYLLPDNKVIKVFKKEHFCDDQLYILQKCQESKLFPIVYSFDSNSIIMEFINGISLSEYIRKNGLNKTISLNLVKLINEFKNLGFTRLDVRTSHIFVQENGSIRVIDPRGSYRIVQNYPTLMLRGLKRLGFLKEFFNFIKGEYPSEYRDWIYNIINS